LAALQPRRATETPKREYKETHIQQASMRGSGRDWPSSRSRRPAWTDWAGLLVCCSGRPSVMDSINV
jgi:hypothetical protein